MMWLFTIVALVLLLCIVRAKGVNKLIFFLSSVFFLHEHVIPWGDYHKLAALCLLISCFKEFGSLHRSLKTFPFTKILAALLALHIANAFFSPYIPLRKALFLSVSTYFVSFGVFFLAYASINTSRDIEKLKKFFSLTLVTIIFFCLVSFVLGFSPILALQGTAAHGVAHGKLSAFMISPNSHAMSLIFPFVFMCFFLKSSKLFYVVIGLILCIGLSSHRASFADLFLAFACILFLGPKTSSVGKKLRIIFGVLFVVCATGFILINFHIVDAGKKIERMADAVQTEDRTAGGSSIAMRLYQLDVATQYYKRRPIWGHGIGYYNNFLQGNGNVGMYGMESFILWLLLEYGVCLIVCICLFLLLVYFYFIKRRLIQREKIYTSIAITTLTVLIFHQVLNRPWGVFEYAWPLMAICIRGLEMKKLENGAQ